jgi:hypothetical protein
MGDMWPWTPALKTTKGQRMKAEVQRDENGHMTLILEAENAAEAIPLFYWRKVFFSRETPRNASIVLRPYPPTTPPPQPALPDGQRCYHCERKLDFDYVGAVFWRDRWWCLKCLGQYE